MDLDLSMLENNVSVAYALLRVALGLDIFLHGVVRWAGGLRHFADPLVIAFQKTPLPHWSVLDFGYVLPIIEAVLGAAILIGFQTRRALIAGGVLMFVLIFGSSLRQDWQIVGLQLIYSLVYAILLAAHNFNRFGIDRLLDRKSWSTGQ
jgi:thiosulfate dehydrogenase (quinone) large subunit